MITSRRTRLLPDPPGPQYVTEPTTNKEDLESFMKCSMNYANCHHSTLCVAAPWRQRDGREPTELDCVIYLKTQENLLTNNIGN